MTYTLSKDYIRYNHKTAKIEYLKKGDKIKPTENELKEYPELFSSYGAHSDKKGGEK